MTNAYTPEMHVVKLSKQFCFPLLCAHYLILLILVRNTDIGTNPQTPIAGIQNNIFERAKRARFEIFCTFKL